MKITKIIQNHNWQKEQQQERCRLSKGLLS